MISSATSQSPQRTVRPALLFLLSCMWILVSLAGGRLAGAFSSAPWYDLSCETFSALMLFAGFYLMARLGIPDLRPLSSVGFVKRPGVAREFGVGAALGWGIALALMLPAVVTRNVTLVFRPDRVAVQQLGIGLLVLIAFAFVLQLILSGLPVRLLVRSIGSAWTVISVLLVGVAFVMSSRAQGTGMLFTALAFCLSVFAFLRTRAVWLPLGLQIGWTISLQLLFGEPSPYTPAASGVLLSDTGGPLWLTGGPFGPEASSIAIVVLIVALLILFRLTRDYAWHYTYQPIVSGGFPLEVTPPAAHLKEAERAPVTAPLVQIGGITPAPPLPPPATEPD